MRPGKLRAAGEESLIVTLVHTEGSTYRRPGARMLVLPGCQTLGTISGGCLEPQVARDAFADVTPELRIYVAHAKGELAVGDIAVVVAAGSRHRDEAFRACRAVIEGVKHRAPIWKQEHYVDGRSEWSEGCSLCGDSVGIAGTP